MYTEYIEAKIDPTVWSNSAIFKRFITNLIVRRLKWSGIIFLSWTTVTPDLTSFRDDLRSLFRGSSWMWGSSQKAFLASLTNPDV